MLGFSVMYSLQHGWISSAKPSGRRSGECEVYRARILASNTLLSINKGAKTSIYMTINKIIMGTTSCTRPGRLNNQ